MVAADNTEKVIRAPFQENISTSSPFKSIGNEARTCPNFSFKFVLDDDREKVP